MIKMISIIQRADCFILLLYIKNNMRSIIMDKVMVISFKKYAFEFYNLASLIAFSRLYLYVQYPT